MDHEISERHSRTSRRHRRRGVLSAAAAVALAVLVLIASGCSGSTGAAAGTGGSTPASGGSPATSASTVATRSATPKAARAATPRATPTARATKKPASSAASTSSRASGSGGSTVALTVVFVDVGQGDAAVLRSGSWAGLVDGGPSGSGAAVDAALGKLGVTRLDTLVISHLHADHIGGLPGIVARFRPRVAWVAGSVQGSLASALRGADTTIVQARRGLTSRFGAAAARVLSPGGLSGDPNSDSVVMLLQAGGRGILFTGDTTGPNEAAVGLMLARGPPVDVLKVAHHGSRYSTTTGFLDGARPRVAVISVGHNSYGHPSSEAVSRLRGSGARVFSTQRSGSITLTVTASGKLTWAFARSAAELTRGVSGGGSGGSSSSSSSGSSGAATSTTPKGDPTVYVTETGECYHRTGCRYLSNSRIAMKLSHAKADGYRPCSVCDPPR